MKLKKMIEVEFDIDIESVGLELAHRDSNDQVDFFEGFSRGFREFSDGDIDGMQMLFLKKELSTIAKEFIVKLAEYISED